MPDPIPNIPDPEAKDQNSASATSEGASIPTIQIGAESPVPKNKDIVPDNEDIKIPSATDAPTNITEQVKEEAPVELSEEKPLQKQKPKIFSDLLTKAKAMIPAKILAKKTQKSEATDKKGSEGNAFTRVFSKNSSSNKSEEVLIENIIEQSHQQEEEQRILDLKKKKQDPEKVLKAEKEKTQKAEEFSQLARVVLGASLLVPLSTFLLSGLFLSTEGFLSTLLPSYNYGIILQSKNTELEQINADIVQKETDTAIFEQKIADITDNEVLGNIVDGRIHWREVFEMVGEVTDRTFEGNQVSKYVAYNSYSGKSADSSITVQGQVRSPDGRTWQDLIKLENSLRNHDNFLFEGLSFSQFSKTKVSGDSQVSSSEYTSPFNLKFKYLSESDIQHAAAEPETGSLLEPEQ